MLLFCKMFSSDCTLSLYELVTSLPLNQLYTVCRVAPVKFEIWMTGKSKCIAHRPNWLPSDFGAAKVVVRISFE